MKIGAIRLEIGNAMTNPAKAGLWPASQELKLITEPAITTFKIPQGTLKTYRADRSIALEIGLPYSLAESFCQLAKRSCNFFYEEESIQL